MTTHYLGRRAWQKVCRISPCPRRGTARVLLPYHHLRRGAWRGFWHTSQTSECRSVFCMVQSVQVQKPCMSSRSSSPAAETELVAVRAKKGNSIQTKKVAVRVKSKQQQIIKRQQINRSRSPACPPSPLPAAEALLAVRAKKGNSI